MKKIIFTLVFIFTVTTVYSTKSYRVLSRGSVKDNSTGMVWTRCSLSADDLPIYDFNCNGEKKLYLWSEAVNACKNLIHEGRSDWRLPSVKELQSIIYYHHYATGFENCSQVVERVFPNVLTSEQCYDTSSSIHYWSSTTHVGKDSNGINYVWFADFKWGNIGFTSLGSPESVRKYVRCVAGP